MHDRSVKEDGEFYTDSVPFSCCDVDSPAPCIHDNVLEASGRYGYNPARELTVYTDGCSAVVSDTLQTTLIGCVLVGLSLVAVRTHVTYAAFYWARELVFTVNTTCTPVPNRSRELEIS